MVSIRKGSFVSPPSLSNRIRCARRSAQLSQAALAEKIGVGPSAVAQWESANGTRPTVDNQRRIAVLCDVAFEWLATGRGQAKAGREWNAAVDAASSAMDLVEERLLLAFRRLASRKRELFLRLLEEML